MLKVPELCFTKWMSWEQALQKEGVDNPGVYFIAFTDKELNNKKVRYEDVVYIGSADDLKVRFEERLTCSINSSPDKIYGHSGFNKIREEYSHLPSKELVKRTFISVGIVNIDELEEDLLLNLRAKAMDDFCDAVPDLLKPKYNRVKYRYQSKDPLLKKRKINL